MPNRLSPAELSFSANGTAFSARFGDVYHSDQGALEQARHVFLAGNNLPERWRRAGSFTILETGFGLGLSFLVTCQAWLASSAPGHLHFVSVEKHPLSARDLSTFWARQPELEPLAGELIRQWPPPVPGMQRMHFAAGRIHLTLLLGDAAATLRHLVAEADAVFLDGFAPSCNPDLWSPKVLGEVKRLSRPGTTLSTWSVAGELRRNLEAAGWQLERRPGFGDKREMLCGYLPGSTPGRPPVARQAIVIGAGLAGAHIGERLAARGWQVDLIERHAAPAQEASGNPTGVVLPYLTRDDAPAARFSRSAYLYALRQLAALPGARWSPCGVVQLARDTTHESVQRATIDELGLPGDFAGFLDRTAASALTGHALPLGGWWFPGGGWAVPASICQALIAAGGARIRQHYGVGIAALRHADGLWQAIATDGRPVASAPHVILANAHAANLLLSEPLPLTTIRGQVSFLPAEMLPPLKLVLCRTGYMTPPLDGQSCLGASFGRGDADLSLRTEDHRENLARLEEMLPGIATGITADKMEGRVGIRTATDDRLPMVGALAPQPGLHVLLGLGARGLVWAPLAAELLASQLDGNPLPLERPLIDALDPARHIRHRLHRT